MQKASSLAQLKSDSTTGAFLTISKIQVGTAQTPAFLAFLHIKKSPSRNSFVLEYNSLM